MTDDLDLDSLLLDLPPLGPLPAGVISGGARRRRVKLAALGGVTALGLTGVVAGVAARAAGPGQAPLSRLVVGTSAGPTSPAPVSPAPAPPTVEPTAPAPTAPAPTATAPTGPTPTGPTPTSDPGLQLVLEPDGLGYLAGPASIRHLTFAGADPGTVERTVAQALGDTATRAPLPDCGAGVQVAVFTGFALFYDQTSFVGWSQTKALTRNPATADGIAVGTTLTELRQAYPNVVVTTGSLGPEWSVPRGLAGGLDGTSATSTVNRVGAGQNCLAR